MRKIYITFSGDRYHNTTERIVKDAPRLGADDVFVYDDVWLMRHRHEFYLQNQWAWNHPRTRGFGWFIWKPFLIMDALNRVNDGDIVLFTDADTYPIHDFSMLYDICKANEGVMLFSAVGCSHRHWCKRDCFIIMGQDEPKYNAEIVQHGVARFMCFQKGPRRPQQFLMEWLAYCCNPLANTFDKSVIAPEYPELREHRCEQAIMTNLAHKYGYKLWREACQYGATQKEDQEYFPQLFHQLGDHTYSPVPSEGSAFRNIND